MWVGMYGKLREERRSRSVEDICAGTDGSDNLLAKVCALISYEYSLFEVLGRRKTKITIQAANNAINLRAAVELFALPANRV